MEPRKLERGDVVQIKPLSDGANIFGGCLMVVDEPKSFGAQGYVQIPGKGQAYFRPTWEQMEYVGKAIWIID